MSNNEESTVENSKSLTTHVNQPGFLGELWQKARLIYRLFLDPEVPFYIKLLPVAAAAYLLFPFDFLPDVIPGFGQLDDLTILVLGAKMFIELAPKHVVERYMGEMQSGSSQTRIEAQGENSAYDEDIIEGIILESDPSAENGNKQG